MRLAATAATRSTTSANKSTDSTANSADSTDSTASSKEKTGNIVIYTDSTSDPSNKADDTDSTSSSVEHAMKADVEQPSVCGEHGVAQDTEIESFNSRSQNSTPHAVDQPTDTGSTACTANGRLDGKDLLNLAKRSLRTDRAESKDNAEHTMVNRASIER